MQNELALLSNLCAATSKIGKVTRGSNLLAMSGVSLAQASRAGTEDRGCLGPREPRGFQLRLRTRNNTRQGQCGRAKSIRLILTNDPVEAPFRLRIASEGHMHEAIRSGWRSTPAQCASSAMGRFVSMPHPAHT